VMTAFVGRRGYTGNQVNSFGLNNIATKASLYQHGSGNSAHLAQILKFFKTTPKLHYCLEMVEILSSAEGAILVLLLIQFQPC